MKPVLTTLLGCACAASIGFGQPIASNSTIIALTGLPSPGGGTFHSLSPADLNLSGEGAFLSETSPPLKKKLIRFDGGLTVIAAEDEPAPGTEAGVTYGGFLNTVRTPPGSRRLPWDSPRPNHHLRQQHRLVGRADGFTSVGRA